MNINMDDANRLNELHNEMMEILNEFKDICRGAMTPREYEMFRYKTLAHLEPGLERDCEWVTTFSAITPLDAVVELTQDSVVEDENEDSEDEAN